MLRLLIVLIHYIVYSWQGSRDLACKESCPSRILPGKQASQKLPQHRFLTKIPLSPCYCIPISYALCKNTIFFNYSILCLEIQKCFRQPLVLLSCLNGKMFFPERRALRFLLILSPATTIHLSPSGEKQTHEEGLDLCFLTSH